MSSSLNVYVGPYLVFSNPLRDIDRLVPGCVPCKRKSNTPFCAKCGAALGNISEPAKGRAVDSMQASEAIGERLTVLRTTRLHDYWVANVDFDGADCHLGYDERIVGISAAVIEGREKDFRASFSKEIEELYRRYNKQPVHVEYGVITYFS